MLAQPTAVRRVWRAIGFGLVVLVIWLSLTPQPIEIPVEQGDKLGHITAYATLMFWFAQLDARHRMRVAYAIGFVMLGVALEFAQRLTDYRTFEVVDMVAFTDMHLVLIVLSASSAFDPCQIRIQYIESIGRVCVPRNASIAGRSPTGP